MKREDVGGNPFRKKPQFFDDSKKLDDAFEPRLLEEICNPDKKKTPDKDKFQPTRKPKPVLKQTITYTPDGSSIEHDPTPQLGDDEERKKHYRGSLKISNSVIKNASKYIYGGWTPV